MKRIILVIGFMFSMVVFTEAQNIVTAAQVNGIWREASSTKSVFTEFWVQTIGNNQLKVGFWGNNAVKKFSNVAIGTADINGITAIFKPAENQVSEDSPCIINLKFTAGKLIVSEKGECGWGNGISTAGTYKKTSPKKPNFKELEQYQ